MEILVCKVCSCVIPREHLDDGRALRNGPGVLCASCCRSVQVSRNVSGRQPTAGSSTRVMASPAPAAQSARTSGIKVSGTTVVPKLPPGVTPRKPKLTRVAADVPAAAPANVSSTSTRSRAVDPSMNLGLAAPKPSSQSGRARTAVMPSATISVRRKHALVCKLCHASVTEEEIASGKALEAENRITCGSCLAAAGKIQGRRWLIAAGIVGIVIGMYFVVPQPTLFIVTLGGIGMTFAGALMSDTAAVQRLGLALAGIVLSVTSFWQITTLRTAAEEAKETAELSSARDEITALLDKNQPLEAQRAVKRLRANDTGATAAHRMADECEAMIVKWLDTNYADCDEIGRKLALALTEVFPSAEGKPRRISAVSANEKRIALTLAAQEDRQVTYKSPESGREIMFDAGFEEAWLVANHLYSSVRSLEQLDLNLTLTTGKQHLLKISASEFEALKNAANPASVLATSK